MNASDPPADTAPPDTAASATAPPESVANRPEASDLRVRFADIFEAETRPHDERFRRAAAIRPGDAVLDIGCGTGGSTREAAAASGTGSVVGVDITTASIEHARDLAAAADLPNARFVVADAQSDDLGRARFDVGISRFGVMFFTHPAVAFANIARALRPGARLVLLVWQARDRNEWSKALRDERVAGDRIDPRRDAFALADPATVRSLLHGAGFSDVHFEPVHEPVWYDADERSATEFVLAMRATQPVPANADETDEVRALVHDHHDPDRGVTFGAATWVITASRT